MNKIIIISGKQYSGKDTLAKILLEEFTGFKRVGIGDAIKIQFGKENNLTFEEIEKNKFKYRDDLIKLGNWGRNQSPTFWLNKLSDMKNIIIPDIRVIDELNFFKSKGAFSIRVNSTFENRSKRGIITNDTDFTETSLDDYNDWDYVIENNSDFESFKTDTKKLIERLRIYNK